MTIIKEFHRDITHKLLNYIEKTKPHKDVLILSGARQVGKTTILKSVLKNKNHIYVNLEQKASLAEQIDACVDFEDFEEMLKDRLGFVPGQQILCLDEAQQSRQLGRFVGPMKENWKEASVILTGSLINELYNETPRRPVGRETFLDMWPLTFREFVEALNQESLVKVLNTFRPGEVISESKHKRLQEMFDLYLDIGGLPEVVSHYLEKQDYQTKRLDILKTYEDDFVRYFSQDDINLFKRSLSAVADHAGSLSKDSQVVRPNAPGYRKVAGILARLEKWKLIIKCEQIGLGPEHNKYAPKRYLYDIGILRDLRLRGLQQISVTQLSQPLLRVPLGGLVENVLALSLKNQFGDQLFGIRLSQNAEIDFAIKHGHAVIPIECKMALRFKTSFLMSIVEYLKKTHSSENGFLFYGGPPLKEPIANCYVLPYYFCDSLKNWLDSNPSAH